MATPTLIAARGAIADHQALLQPVLAALGDIVIGKTRSSSSASRACSHVATY